MRLLASLIILVLGTQVLTAQSLRSTPTPNKVENKTQDVTFPFVSMNWNDFSAHEEPSVLVETPITFSSLGIGWQSTNSAMQAGEFHIEYRYRKTNGNWSKWAETHGETNPSETPTNLYWSHLIITDYLEQATAFEVKFEPGAFQVTTLRIDASNISNLSDGKDAKHVSPSQINTNAMKSAGCPEPKYVIPRSDWWDNLPADELSYPNATNSKTVSYNSNTTHTYVHHGASSNSYTDGASVVRGYWSYHVNSKGWKDIGYNYVMDKFGNLYLARYNPDWPNRDCLGAHTGSSNTYSFATCFAGNLQDLNPTQIAIDSLKKLLAWKCDLRGMDPVGTGTIVGQVKDIISGHRDAPSASTACPGDSLYAKLPEVRLGAKALLDACGAAPTTPTAFAVLNESATSARIIVELDTIVDEYLVYQSTDGLTFTGPTNHTGNNFVVSGLPSDAITYFKIQASNAEGTTDFTEVLAATPSATTSNVMVVNGFDRALADNTYDFIRQHGSSIANYGHKFSSATNEAVELGIVSLNTYEIVDYIIGEESTVDETFNSAEQTLVKNYLDNGGKLFVSGAEIGWDLDNSGSTADQSFYNDYLKATYVNDAPNNQSATHYTVDDITGEIFDGIDTVNFDDGTNGTYDVNWPDAINVSGGSSLCMQYNGVTQYAGVRFEGTFPGGSTNGKLVHLGVPFETFYPELKRDQIMEKVLDFFEDPVVNPPTVSNDATYCTGETITDITATANSGGTITWYSDAGLTNQLGTGATYSPANTVGTTTYYATETVNAVESNAEAVSITINQTPTANAGNDKSVCDGESTDITAAGGGTYNWDNNLGAGASHTVTPNTTTTYIVTVTDNGCADTDDITVSVQSLPIINTGSIVISDASCGSSDGSITGITTSGSGVIIYNWEDGNNSSVGSMQDLTNIGAGVYSLIVTDDFCETTSTAFTVTESGAPSVPSSSGGNTYCAGDNINDLTASGGGGTLTWYSDAGLTTQVGAGTTYSPGNITTTMTYYVTESSGGCESAASSELVTVNPIPVADAGSNQNICSGTSTQIVATGGSSYSWGNALGSGATKTVNPTNTTTYTVTVTDNGCSSTDVVTVSVTNTPIADAGTNQVICGASSTTITASGGGTYFWDNGLGSGASHSVSPSTTTSYSVTVTDNGCTDIDMVTISVSNTIVADAGSDQTMCAGGSVTITATGGTSYNWDNTLGSGASKTVSPSATTTYTVTVTQGSCSATDMVTVSVTYNPTADAGVNTTICAGETVILTATGGSTYNWDNGVGTGATQNVSPTTNTVYSVTVTENGCTDADAVTITVNALPTVDENGVQVVTSDCGLNNGSISGITASGAGTISYNWENSLGNSVGSTIDLSGLEAENYQLEVTDDNCSNTSSVFTVNESNPAIPTVTGGGSYCEGEAIADLTATVGVGSITWYLDASLTTVVGTGTTFNPGNIVSTQTYYAAETQGGCESSADSATVVINNLPVVTTSGDATICSGNSADLSVNGGIEQVWSNGDSTAVISVSPMADATFSVTVFDAFGCTNQASIDVTVNQSPVANFTADDIVNYAPDYTETFTNGSTNADSYLWYFGDGSNSLVESPSHTYSSIGNYVVTLIASNPNCLDSASLTVTVADTAGTSNNPLASFQLTNSVICIDDSVQFLNTSSGASNYEWAFTNAAPAISTDVNPYVSFAATGHYDVMLIANSGAFADTLQTSVYIEVYEEPFADFIANPTTVYLPDSVQFISTSTFTTGLFWNFGDGTNGQNDTVYHAYADTGWYDVTLIATNNVCAYNDVKVETNYIHVMDTTPYVVAQFTATTNSHCESGQLTFNNISLNATSYEWLVDGSMVSTDTDLMYTFPSSGSYLIELIAYGNSSVDTFAANMSINVLASPQAGFYSNDTIVYLPNTTANFVNTSGGATTSVWHFGDGQTSSDNSPWHTYGAQGTYTVSLVVSNACGTDSIALVDYIQITNAPVTMADFTMDNAVICEGGTVNFTNLSTNATDYQWTFTGGVPGVSIAPNPSVVFNNQGMYTVTLEASNGTSVDSTSQQIEVLAAPNANFTASDIEVYSGATIGFTNQSTNANSFEWDFGNGSTSTVSSAWSQYNNVGYYNVTLIASNGVCPNDTTTKAEYIHVLPPVGLEELGSLSLAVYPNPVVDELIVTSNLIIGEQVDVEVIDVTGRLIMQETMSWKGQLEIVTQQWGSGVYQLIVTTSTERNVVSVVKEN